MTAAYNRLFTPLTRARRLLETQSQVRPSDVPSEANVAGLIDVGEVQRLYGVYPLSVPEGVGCVKYSLHRCYLLLCKTYYTYAIFSFDVPIDFAVF